MSEVKDSKKKITTHIFQEKKQRGEMITMLTAYDYSTALAIDQAGIDAVLVGDSLGMVVLGYENTLPVTLEVMLHHCKAVARGARTPLLIGDMPFMSYQVSPEKAVENAGCFLQEAGMDAVKLEGGRERLTVVKRIVDAGIPVMGHLGLTPQKLHQLGGFRAQGKTALAAKMIFEDAIMLQDAGCFGIVLEAVPTQLATYITKHVEIPTIGIGAGAGCDGQVLVTHDLLGLFDRFTPKFVKQYLQIYKDMVRAFEHFKSDVDNRSFPESSHSISLLDEVWEVFLSEMNDQFDEQS